MLTINDVLNINKCKMKTTDHYVIVLKSGDTCFTLGEYCYYAWISGSMDLSSYVYTNMCLKEEIVKKVVLKAGKNRLFKYYIDNEDLQADIYLMEDRAYNERQGRTLGNRGDNNVKNA